MFFVVFWVFLLLSSSGCGGGIKPCANCVKHLNPPLNVLKVQGISVFFLQICFLLFCLLTRSLFTFSSRRSGGCGICFEFTRMSWLTVGIFLGRLWYIENLINLRLAYGGIGPLCHWRHLYVIFRWKGTYPATAQKDRQLINITKILIRNFVL